MKLLTRLRHAIFGPTKREVLAWGIDPANWRITQRGERYRLEWRSAWPPYEWCTGSSDPSRELQERVRQRLIDQKRQELQDTFSEWTPV